MSASWEFQTNPQGDVSRPCVFCKIAVGEAPARVAYQDDDILVIHNHLQWIPVMLLVMPKMHMSQREMWESAIMARIAEVAVQMGKTHSPDGFRLLSNFGHQAMQSQAHGHLHVLGGTSLGRYL